VGSDYVAPEFGGRHQYFLIDSNDYALFFFQWTFAAVSATIVSGAVCERMTVIAYVIINLFMGFLIYPFVAHSAWGGGWLLRFGYVDFAGSGVVHLTGNQFFFTLTVRATVAHLQKQEGLWRW